MTEPWNLTEAQRRQFREAHAEAKRRQMTSVPDFSDWTLDRLLAQRDHLESLLSVSAGQNDPVRPQLQAEWRAVCAEITHRRAQPPAPEED